MSKEVVAYTDGSALRNPEGGYFGGAGAVLLYKGKEKRLSVPIPEGTNNIAELTAAIIALEALNESCDVKLHTDSMYVINCVTKWMDSWKKRGWKTQNKTDVKNKELIVRLDEARCNHQVEFIWVKGHDGDKYNELADELAVMASNKLKEEVLGECK